jgi:Uma2 family endonuclease
MPAEQEQLTLVLGPRDEGKLLSADEFAHAEFVLPWKYEREEGRLVVMPPDGSDHDRCSEPLRDHLGAYRLAHRDLVELVVSEAWVRVDGRRDRIGDIGVFLATDLPVAERPERAPDLMFEIVSDDSMSKHRDYVLKRAEYHRLGIREYVIVDRFAKTVLVLTHRPEGYEERTLTERDVYASGLLPGLEIPLNEIFRK